MSANAADVADSLLETTRRLVGALQREPSSEQRLSLAKRLLRQLGDGAYPVFLKILLVVAESEDTHAKQIIADLLAIAAQRMDLPSGQLSSWGGSAQDEGPVNAGGMSRRRLLGPLEYLTVWYCQPTQRPMLEEALYADALRKLLTLFDLNPNLHRLYVAKLAADAGNQLEGTYTRDTREMLRRLAEGWGDATNNPAKAVQHALRGHAPETAVPSGWIIHRL